MLNNSPLIFCYLVTGLATLINVINDEDPSPGCPVKSRNANSKLSPLYTQRGAGWHSEPWVSSLWRVPARVTLPSTQTTSLSQFSNFSLSCKIVTL